MRILITAATTAELLPAREFLELINNQEDTHLCETGIGSTATTYHTLKALTAASDRPYDLAINIGIAGSLSKDFPIGSVARVVSDYFGDCGIQTASGFQSLFDARLINADTFPFSSGKLIPPPLAPELESALASIAVADAVTMQHLVETGLATLDTPLRAQIETMEGAAFFYVCMFERLPCLALRAVSNKAGERDKAKWDIPLALSALKKSMSAIINRL